MQRADLVAVGIAHIGKIELRAAALTPAGRILDALAAVRDGGIVERLDLLRAVAAEADRAAIGMRSRLAIDRLGEAEHAGRRAIKDATLRIGLSFGYADGAECRIVELLRRRDVIRADENVSEHRLLLWCANVKARDRRSLDWVSTPARTELYKPPLIPRRSDNLRCQRGYQHIARLVTFNAQIQDAGSLCSAILNGTMPPTGNLLQRQARSADAGLTYVATGEANVVATTGAEEAAVIPKDDVVRLSGVDVDVFRLDHCLGNSSIKARPAASLMPSISRTWEPRNKFLPPVAGLSGRATLRAFARTMLRSSHHL